MCICDTYVVDAYVMVLGFNLDEIVVNSDGYNSNDLLIMVWFGSDHGPHLVALKGVWWEHPLEIHN
jgi:hypothetical protein